MRVAMTGSPMCSRGCMIIPPSRSTSLLPWDWRPPPRLAQAAFSSAESPDHCAAALISAPVRLIPWYSPDAHRPTRIPPCGPLSQPRCRAGATFSIALSLTNSLALSLAKLFGSVRPFRPVPQV